MSELKLPEVLFELGEIRKRMLLDAKELDEILTKLRGSAPAEPVMPDDPAEAAEDGSEEFGGGGEFRAALQRAAIKEAEKEEAKRKAEEAERKAEKKGRGRPTEVPDYVAAALCSLATTLKLTARQIHELRRENLHANASPNGAAFVLDVIPGKSKVATIEMDEASLSRWREIVLWGTEGQPADPKLPMVREKPGSDKAMSERMIRYWIKTATAPNHVTAASTMGCHCLSCSVRRVTVP